MKKIVILLICCSALLFSGCSFGSFSVDTLLAAPKLSEEQEGIYKALMDKVGSNITLKYPKSGSYRSAYVVVNIDDEPGDEAIVFYEYNSNPSINNNAQESGVRYCVLDKNEKGKWEAVYDRPGAGTDVDRIIVSTLDGSGNINVIVGYSTLNINDKILEIYSYSDGNMTTVAADSYSVIETLDIDNDGYNEILTVQSGGDSGTASASLLSVVDGQIVRMNIIPMSERFQSVASVASYVKGKLTEYNKALFIDSSYDENSLQTEFIYYRYNSLQNPVATLGEDLVLQTVRPNGYYSKDVDGDGIIEIPTVVPMKGYELLAPEDQIYLTTWSAYEEFFKLSPKYVGYYSISNGYMISFSEDWQKNVTVKRDPDSGEAVFYLFGTTLEDTDTELMRITVCSRNEAEKYEKLGYQRITSVGEIDYLVRITEDGRNDMSLDLSAVKRKFFVVS